MIRKTIPFSTMYVVKHTENEMSFGCKTLQVEGFAKLVDDPHDDQPAIVHADIDLVLCGQEDLKPTLEMLDAIHKIQEHANDYAHTLFND